VVGAESSAGKNNCKHLKLCYKNFLTKVAGFAANSYNGPFTKLQHDDTAGQEFWKRVTILKRRVKSCAMNFFSRLPVATDHPIYFDGTVLGRHIYDHTNLDAKNCP